jgi:hypothetical protein
MVDHTGILADRTQILASVLDVERGKRATAAVLLLGATNRTLWVGARGY